MVATDKQYEDPAFPPKSAAQKAAENEAENTSVSGSYVNDPDLRASLTKPAAKAWIPNVGDAVAGTVVDIQTAESEYGWYPLIELDCGSRNLAIHCYHTTLQSDIERRNVQPGDKLAIAYLGEKASKNSAHNAFHIYRVIHQPKAPF